MKTEFQQVKSLKGQNRYLVSCSLTQRKLTQFWNHKDGLPMTYFDQLATIAKHLHKIKFDDDSQPTNTSKLNNSVKQTKKYFIKMLDAVTTYGTLKSVKAILPKNRRSSTKLTRCKLKKLPECPQWLKSEFKQLDQYNDQTMFGKPCPLTPNANVLELLWTYQVKIDGTKKARCVCNGQPKFKGTDILGYTFAKMLDHV